MQKLIESILRIKNEKGNVLVAIDGRCASGKTTLAENLKGSLLAKGEKVTVIHIDEFFLRPEQRTKERLSVPGENIDHERFLEEVLKPINNGGKVKYRPFDCSIFALAEEKEVEINDIIIIEGSYSLNKNLSKFYDYKIFVTSDIKTRLDRILVRNGEKMQKVFIERWIPMEESYFEAFNIESECDFVLVT